MSELVFDEKASFCLLCGDTGMVEIIPHGGTVNDARLDECPWCLRRSMMRPKASPAPVRSTPHVYQPNPKYRHFCHDCGYPPHDTLMHVQPVVWPALPPERKAPHGHCPCGVRLTKKTAPFGRCTRCQTSGLY